MPKTNEDYDSVIYSCLKFIEIFRFLSSSLRSLIKTLVDNKDRTLGNFEKQIAGDDNILNIVSG